MVTTKPGVPRIAASALQVARGLTNREIAQTLFLSPKTVEFHLTRIYRKLDLNARLDLVNGSVGRSRCAETPVRAL